jgi:hypothetical protein
MLNGLRKPALTNRKVRQNKICCCFKQLVIWKTSKGEDKDLWQVTAQSQFTKYGSENKEGAHFSETRQTLKVRESVL